MAPVKGWQEGAAGSHVRMENIAAQRRKEAQRGAVWRDAAKPRGWLSRGRDHRCELWLWRLD